MLDIYFDHLTINLSNITAIIVICDCARCKAQANHSRQQGMKNEPEPDARAAHTGRGVQIRQAGDGMVWLGSPIGLGIALAALAAAAVLVRIAIYGF
ncbi:hypothetical protein [Mesorhizobium sp.]|uniref:hypothetical protein n=1 Tax=Mesorhizobium sp. TaxID=1871066 RepID=UPI0025F98E1C|nr:hypothetical protein [Mesorhizobium sp.]